MSSADWLVTGNDGIDPARNFLGTTDNQPLTIKTNGAERIRVDTAGNVGIGTSGPVEKLHVEGGDVYVNGEGNGVIVDAASLRRIGLMKYPNREAMLIGSSQLPSPIRLGRWEGGTITAPGQIHEDLVINSQGSVGIGTQSPASKLHVNVDASPNPIKALTVEVKSFGTAENAQASYFVAVQEPPPVLGIPIGAQAQVLSPPGVTPDPFLHQPNTHFLIRGDGNVGIGTSQPAEKLHVDGNVRVDGNVGIGTDTPGFKLDVNERIRLRGDGPANTAGLWLFQASKDQAFVGMANDSQVGLFGNNGTNWGLVMDTADGNVGIGTLSPVSKLHVDVAASPNPIGAVTIDVASFETTQNAQASYFLRVRDIGASSLPPHFLIRGDGNVGIGTSQPTEKLSVNGNVTVTGDVLLPGADCAEHFDLCGARSLEPGTVVIIDQVGAVRESGEAYDKKVAGVVSGAGEFRHAIVLDRRPSEEPRVPVALLGKVYCKVDARCSPIEVGDFLTTSPTPGHAMKALDPMRAMGSVIGKALRPLEAGQGMIPILIALQ
jgi:hypothetical protein